MRPIETVAVIGAGDFGRRIAYAAARAGYQTILRDILPGSLRKAEAEIRDRFEQQVESGDVARREADEALARIEYATSLEDAARAADLVIEAVPDEMESKLEIFILLDKVCRPETLVASHSRHISLTELAGMTYRAPFCIGMRFGDSGRIEVVRGAQTSQEAFDAAIQAARRMDAEAALAEDLPLSAAEL